MWVMTRAHALGYLLTPLPGLQKQSSDIVLNTYPPKHATVS